MSNGEATGSATPGKKVHYVQKMKDDHKRETDELLARIRQLEAAEQVAPALASVNASAPPTITAESDNPDCLSFITDDVPYVAIVSHMSTITLRPGKPKMTPPMIPLVLSASRPTAWANCPFMLDDPRDPENAVRRRVFNSGWWHHVITREMAEDIWADERYRKPEFTVFQPHEFTAKRGWDSVSRRPRSAKDKITEFIPLREATRIVLMRLSKTFLDYGNRPEELDFDPRYPNPYNNRISGVEKIPVPRPELAAEDAR